METIINFLRAPASKIITRAILYGLTAIFAKLGIDAAEASGPSAAISDAVVTVLFLVLSAIVDRLHHNADTKPQVGTMAKIEETT